MFLKYKYPYKRINANLYTYAHTYMKFNKTYELWNFCNKRFPLLHDTRHCSLSAVTMEDISLAMKSQMWCDGKM